MNKVYCVLIIFYSYSTPKNKTCISRESCGIKYYVERATISRKKEDKEIEEKYDKCQPFLLYVLHNIGCEK